MKTDELIQMLAQGAGAAPRSVVARRFWPAMLLALPLAAAVSLYCFEFVPDETLAQAGWWIKLGYALLVALVSGLLAARLARPGAPSRGPVLLLAGLVLLMAAAGLWQWSVSMPAERGEVLLGHSWDECPQNILLASIPALALGLWAMRGLAPTRPVWAGAVTGLLAGGVGASGYALTCTEITMSFVAVWYTLGMLLPALLGAVLGPRLLRW